jgi:hypothetical protein
MKLQPLFPAVLTGLLFACSEGGTGGTGGILPLPATSTSSVGGFANKGPFRTGTTIELSEVDSSGSVGSIQATASTATNFGDFLITADRAGPVFVSSAGNYFSEVSGDIEGPITLSMIVDLSADNEIHNINLLTTLSVARIQVLMADGMQAGPAIAMAESELLLGFSDLLGVIDNTSGFSKLIFFNNLQEQADTAGNGYLLAISSLFEQVVRTRSSSNGMSPAENMQTILSDVAEDLADDGSLSQQDLLVEVSRAMSTINPDQILFNLFSIQPTVQQDALESSTLSDAANVSCVVRLSNLNCTDTDNDSTSTTFSAIDIIADINRFIDSDGDGIVNRDDDDDDDDGVADVDDETPYGD